MIHHFPIIRSYFCIGNKEHVHKVQNLHQYSCIFVLQPHKSGPFPKRVVNFQDLTSCHADRKLQITASVYISSMGAAVFKGVQC